MTKTKKAQVGRPKKETGIVRKQSVMTQADIPNQIAEFEAQLAILKGEKDETISTDIEFEDGEKIKDVKTVGRLLEVSAAIHERDAAYNREIQRYGLKNVASYNHNGKPVDEWRRIIAKAIKELVNQVQIQLLEKTIQEFSELMDAETKLSKKLEQLRKQATQPLI
jgi:hypothetical protein